MSTIIYKDNLNSNTKDFSHIINSHKNKDSYLKCAFKGAGIICLGSTTYAIGKYGNSASELLTRTNADFTELNNKLDKILKTNPEELAKLIVKELEEITEINGEDIAFFSKCLKKINKALKNFKVDPNDENKKSLADSILELIEKIEYWTSWGKGLTGAVSVANILNIISFGCFDPLYNQIDAYLKEYNL